MVNERLCVANIRSAGMIFKAMLQSLHDIVNDIVGKSANTCIVVGGNNKNFVNATGVGHGVNGAEVVYCQVAIAVESGVEVWHYA